MFNESTTVEFKAQYTDEIKKTVIAFINTEGGTIYIGVDDDGNAVGVGSADQVILQTTNAIRDAIRPDATMFTTCEHQKMEGKDIIAVKIQRGTARPYYLSGKGIRPEGVYVRQGASSVPATETAILKMIRDTSGDCFEDERSLEQQLTFTRTSDIFRKLGVPFKEVQKKTLGLVGADGTYTNLALLLSEQCGHTIKLAVFEGTVKTVFRDRCEITGSLLGQMEDSFLYIDRFNRTRSEFGGLERIDTRDYPPEAIREALLNSIVHRDYAFSSSILVSIFDDRIEMVSIGGLLRGITYDDIMLGVSAPRNRKLANVFYRLKLIEAYGTGIQKIMNNYDGYPVKPKIDISDNAFRITLPNVNYIKETLPDLRGIRAASPREETIVDDREGTILQMLRGNSVLVRKDIQEKLGVSQATAILILRDMTRKGLLIKDGGGKLTKYRRGK